MVRAEEALSTEPAALNFTKTRSLWQADPNLTGKGMFIGTICRSMTYINGEPAGDFHFNMKHNALYDADVLFSDQTDGYWGISEHATSIAGILLGLEENATYPASGRFSYRGICPDATVNTYEFNQFAKEYLFDKHPIEEDIILLSLGHEQEEWWTRSLEQASESQDFLVVASTGNGADANAPKPIYPGAGANVLGVGVIDSSIMTDGTISLKDFSAPHSTHSAIGPTEDLRCKPDLVAPGTALVPAANSETGYRLERNGTSLAAPIVAGTAALLQQTGLSTDGLNGDFNQPGKSVLLKTILINSAKKLPYWHKGRITDEDDHETPLDYAQGAGLLGAMAAYNQLTAGAAEPGSVKTTGWDNRTLTDSEEGYLYGFSVNDPNQMITATLCWNRVYEAEYPFNYVDEKNADRRLELWGIDPNDPAKRVLLDYSDSVDDNVEHIYFTCDPNYPAYAIRVQFSENQNIPVQQRFALAWSVGPDRQLDNKWWYDLNADNIINTNDKVIYSLIEANLIDRAEIAPLLKTAGLSEKRLQLLVSHWDQWKPYLADWDTFPQN